MTASVLVAYATHAGATQEVAAAVAATLQAAGARVDLHPAREVAATAGYDLVILGAPLYMFRWHPDAFRFLARHRASLARLPVAIFALGPFHNKTEELTSAAGQLEKELGRVSWLQPVARTVFVGRFDAARLHFPWNLVPGLKAMEPCDERDWELIHAWAAGLVQAV